MTAIITVMTEIITENFRLTEKSKMTKIITRMTVIIPRITEMTEKTEAMTDRTEITTLLSILSVDFFAYFD